LLKTGPVARPNGAWQQVERVAAEAVGAAAAGWPSITAQGGYFTVFRFSVFFCRAAALWAHAISGSAEIVEYLLGSFLQEGVPSVGGDLGEGYHDEGSFVHKWVWQLELRFVKDGVVVEEQVEVDGAGAPVLVASASELVFDVDHDSKQVGGGQVGGEFGSGVEEGRLAGRAANGCGLDGGRDLAKVNVLVFVEECQGLGQEGRSVADVAAEGDIGGVCGRWDHVQSRLSRAWWSWSRVMFLTRTCLCGLV